MVVKGTILSSLFSISNTGYVTIFALALMFSGVDSAPVLEDRIPGSMDLYMTSARKYVSCMADGMSSLF